MGLEKEVWSDYWHDHHLEFTWGKKYKDWTKSKDIRQRHIHCTGDHRGNMHVQPKRYQQQPEKEYSFTPYAKFPDYTSFDSTVDSKLSTLSRKAQQKAESKRVKSAQKENTQDTFRRTVSWDPNGDFHDDYSESTGRNSPNRPENADLRLTPTSNKANYEKARHYHNCQHEGNCEPVGYYYNQVDPWICRFCNKLDHKQKQKKLKQEHRVDKYGRTVDDKISIINNERRAHLENRQIERKKGNVDMRAVEEMAYRMNMAARSGQPIDYRNHMECKVHWRM